MSDSEKSVISPPTYSCRKCNKTFATPQALGGHQGAHRQPKNDGATSSPAAITNTTITRCSPHTPSYPSSSTTTNSNWGGSSGTGLTFYILESSSNSSRPSLHELPLFPLAPKTTATSSPAAITNTTITRCSPHTPSYPSRPSLHELPLFPLAPKTTAEGDAKMTNQDPDAWMTNQDPDTNLHL